MKSSKPMMQERGGSLGGTYMIEQFKIYSNNPLLGNIGGPLEKISTRRLKRKKKKSNPEIVEEKLKQVLEDDLVMKKDLVYGKGFNKRPLTMT